MSGLTQRLGSRRGLAEAPPSLSPVPAPAKLRGAGPAAWAGRAAVAGAVLTGGLERLWVATHTLGTLTSDGAVIGLMALQLLHHGQLPAYMWGQAYGGSLEAVFTAMVFAVTGVGTAQLLAASALSSALAALALWRTGRRVVGERAATVGALAFWIWSANFAWRSLKPGGTYMIGLALSLCAVGALARIRHGEDGGALLLVAGALCGLAFWSSPMSLQLLVPAAVWCLAPIWRLGRGLGALVAGAVLGAAPVIGFGLSHHWTNLVVPGGSMLDGIPSRLAQFFAVEAPIAMSLRVEGSLAWVWGPAGMALAAAAAVGVLATALAVARGRATRCTLPVLTLVTLPLLFSLNVLADHVGQGRYVLFGSSMGALLVGVGLVNAGPALARLRRAGPLGRGTVALWPVGLVLLGLLGVVALGEEPAATLVGFPAPDVPMPQSTNALVAALRVHRVHDAYANYWIAYRVTFETRQGTDVAPLSNVRYPPLARSVGASPDPAYVFVATSATVGRFEAWCAQAGDPVRRWRAGSFVIVQPRVKVVPSEVPASTLD